jgi:hypothetical protein
MCLLDLPVRLEEKPNASTCWVVAIGSSSTKEVGAVSYAKQLLDTYPRDFNLDAGVLAAAIDACRTAPRPAPPAPTTA